jgi:23S rRNA (pseudouridine1915-N3)-methyltransferase
VRLALIAAGRPKAAYIMEGLHDYAARLKPQGGCELIFTRAVKAGSLPPAQAMAREAELLLAKLEPRDRVWALDRQGRPWSSLDWASRLDQARQSAAPRLALVIGGPDGLAPSLLSRAQQVVSFGPLTLPHELAALVALEQLYRALSILASSPYHR